MKTRGRVTSERWLPASVVLACALALTLTGCSGGTNPDTAPVINSITFSAASVAPGDSVLVTVVATDAENQPLTFAYALAADAGSISGSGNQVRWRLPGDPSNYTLSISVSDGKNVTTRQGYCAVTGDLGPIPTLPPRRTD